MGSENRHYGGKALRTVNSKDYSRTVENLKFLNSGQIVSWSPFLSPETYQTFDYKDRILRRQAQYEYVDRNLSFISARETFGMMHGQDVETQEPYKRRIIAMTGKPDAGKSTHGIYVNELLKSVYADHDIPFQSIFIFYDLFYRYLIKIWEELAVRWDEKKWEELATTVSEAVDSAYEELSQSQSEFCIFLEVPAIATKGKTDVIKDRCALTTQLVKAKYRREVCQIDWVGNHVLDEIANQQREGAQSEANAAKREIYGSMAEPHFSSQIWNELLAASIVWRSTLAEESLALTKILVLQDRLYKLLPSQINRHEIRQIATVMVYRDLILRNQDKIYGSHSNVAINVPLGNASASQNNPLDLRFESLEAEYTKSKQRFLPQT